MTTRAFARRRRRPGFTLIELLVVISIIALLLAILLPSLTKAKQLAVRGQCASNLHHLYLVYSMYANENDSWLPYNWRNDTNADMIWLTAMLRDELLSKCGAMQGMWDCPGIKTYPRTGCYYPDWPTPGFAYSWDIPWPGSPAIGIPSVPTGYELWGGRVDGYRNVLVAYLPRKLDDRPTMMDGSTVTPWLNCNVSANASGTAFNPNPVTDTPMHAMTGINAALPDGAVVFKPFHAPLNSDINGDPDVAKFVEIKDELELGPILWHYGY